MTVDNFNTILFLLLGAALAYPMYLAYKYMSRKLLALVIRTKLFNGGQHEGYIMKNGYLSCDTPVTPYFPNHNNNVIYTKRVIEAGNKQIGNKTKIFFDISPTSCSKSSTCNISARPVNEMNYYIDYTPRSSKSTFGSNVTFDSTPVNVSTLKYGYTNNIKSTTHMLSPSLWYEHQDRLNDEGKALINLIKNNDITSDTKYIRITESILTTSDNNAYVYIIGKYNAQTSMFDVEYMFTSLSSLHTIVEDGIIEKKMIY